jgi:hypothetical protein
MSDGNIIAFDPGKNGGVAIYWGETKNTTAQNLPPTDRGLLEVIEDVANLGETTAYLEDIVKFAGTNMPSSSMAAYASSWGFLRGVIVAKQIRLVLVPPQKWQKALGLGSSRGMSKTEWKNKLKNMAEQLNPHLKVTLATADALLICEAARKGLL